jgi:hypothetical protein
MGGVYNYVNLHTYHYAGNNPVKLVDPDGMADLPRLLEIAKTIRDSGHAKRPGERNSLGIDLFLNKPNDGCFARTSIIADLLRKEGYEVDYAVTDRPLMFGEPEGGKTFRFHIAATVKIDDETYVIDPYYSTLASGISKLEDWINAQKPQGSRNESGYSDSARTKVLENSYIRGWFNSPQNKNKQQSIVDYATKMLKHYNDTDKIVDYDGL